MHITYTGFQFPAQCPLQLSYHISVYRQKHIKVYNVDLFFLSFSLSLSSPTHCCLISHRHCVDHSESVLCVHSAYLFHSHQQTHTSMWMDHVGFSWSVTLTFNSNDTIFKTFHNKQKDVILLICLHCLHYFSNCLIDF